MSAEDEKVELYILKGLLSFQDYVAKFSDRIQPEYFSPEIGPVIKGIKRFYNKYGKSPSLQILCDNLLPKCFKDDEDQRECAEDKLHTAYNLSVKKDDFYDWLSDETKNFVRNRSMRDALIKAVDLVQKEDIDSAVKIIQDAGSLSFDDDLGLDYTGDLDERIERMRIGDAVIPSGISILDKNIGGGWHKKSLNIFGAATNVGKTLILSDISTKLIRRGYNGLYITLEIYSDLLANRIDANLTEIPLSDLCLDPDLLCNTLRNLKKQAEEDNNPFGRLIIKEYAPNCLTSNGILNLVRELELKKQFKPDFICIDYIGLLAPNSKTKNDNTYQAMKRTSEEVRAIGSILDVPMFSAVQVNRDGYDSSHVGLQNTSDSMGIPMSADLMIMVTRDENMEQENKMWWSIAKSRYSRNSGGFALSVDYPYMRLTCDEDLSEMKEYALQLRQAKQEAHRTIREEKAQKKEDINNKVKKEDRPKKKKDSKDLNKNGGEGNGSVQKKINL